MAAAAGDVRIRYHEEPYDITFPNYPTSPSEDYVKDIQERILAEFGLSSTCEFDLVKSGGTYSLRFLPPGEYDLRITKLAKPISRLTSFEPIGKSTSGSVISLSGTSVVTRRGPRHLLQVIESHASHLDASQRIRTFFSWVSIDCAFHNAAQEHRNIGCRSS